MTTRAPKAVAAGIAALVFLSGPNAAEQAGAAPDPEAAARQYRVARRLAAERSAEAGEALAKVVRLDPSGPLADDALVDQALLLGMPEWPDEGGRVSDAALEKAVGFLSRAAESSPAADRAAEARYRKGLLLLEPLPSRDPERARAELLTAASSRNDSGFALRARYAMAWLDEIEGRVERARASYQRVAIDSPGSAEGRRARLGLARMLIREGRPGRAAALVQENFDSGEGATPEAEALRNLAVRAALRGAEAGGRFSGATAEVVPTGARDATAMLRVRDGGVLIADGRSSSILRVGADGSVGGFASLGEVLALAEDPFGRVFAAAGENLYRIDGAGPVVVGSQGDFAPVGALLPDASGSIFVLDRRGERVGRVDAAGGPPGVVATAPKGSRLASLAWDGSRVLSLDTRGLRLFEVSGDGSLRELASVSSIEKPQALSSNRCGEIAVLDGKAGEVVLFGPSGEILDRFTPVASGKGGAEMFSLGADGSLDVLVDDGASLVRVP